MITQAPPSMRARRLWLCLGLALLMLGCDQQQSETRASSASKDLKPVDFLLDWQAEPTYLGIFYAQHEGYFEKVGYSINIIQSWGANQAVAAVASGKYIIGTASGGATVLGRNNGAEVISLAVLYPQIPTVVYGLSSKNVHGPEDLKGKRIGIYPGSITSNEFDAFLKVNHIGRNEITINSLSGPDIPLLLSDKVDGVLHYTEMSPVHVETDPQIPGTNGTKTFELKLAQYGVDGYGLNVIGNEQAWKSNPAQFVALRDAIVLGYKNGCANRTSAVTAFLKQFPDKEPGYVKASWDRVCELVGSDIGAQSTSGWQKTIDLYRHLGLLQTNVVPSQIMGK